MANLPEKNTSKLSPWTQAATDLAAPIMCPLKSSHRDDPRYTLQCLTTQYDGQVELGQVVTDSNGRVESIVLRCQGWDLDPDMFPSQVFFNDCHETHPCTTANCPMFRHPATIRIKVA